MESYTIMPKPACLDWSHIPQLNMNCALWRDPAGISASAKLCYDEHAIYVQMSAKEKHVRAERTSVLDLPSEDSCLEFFFCPPDENRYLNIEFNPNCCLYLGIGHDRYTLVRMVLQNHDFQPQATRTEDGWNITYQVPLSFIQLFFPGFALVSGASIRANCFKCGDLTPHPHYLSWNPVTSETPDFHRLQDFGIMHFG